MELKVWVDGALRVVCGLSQNTSCQDVVISLAQAIGQTGRYVLIMKVRGTERPLVADECPLQQLVQLGQLASEVQFILRRNGSVLRNGPRKPIKEKHPPKLGPSEAINHKGSQKTLSFSTLPRRTKRRKNSSSSLVDTADTFVSPVTPTDRSRSVDALPSGPPKEETFREILQQHRRLHELKDQIKALEKETELWEQKITYASVPDPIPNLTQELEELEFRLKQNKVELMYGENWEKEMKVELEREQEMQRRLREIHLSIEQQSSEIQVHQTSSADLEKELEAMAQTAGPEPESRSTDEALRSLTQELHKRLQLGEEMDAALAKTQWKLQTAEERVKGKLEVIENLNKELRQCDLQQFIRQTGAPLLSEQNNNYLPVNQVYLSNNRIRK
nr:ras association domain-containing protein 8 isoform X1 [Nothobranchius furzeri]XP_054587837.1 ras association domain-containing protein 8 isoform X1 [Nothobranchius furzeri]